MSPSLSGVVFRTQPPPVADKLPRMDVAAFVGFASSGPVNVPVAVEDALHFREIFGDDLGLAWDTTENRPGLAYLASAVRAFFENGGRRCWVVRVADEDTLVTQVFPIPGLGRVIAGPALAAATATARSPGSWADELRLESRLRRTRLNVVFDHLKKPPSSQAATRPGGVTVVLASPTPPEASQGDLIRLTFRDKESTVPRILEGYGEALAHAQADGKADGNTLELNRVFWLGPLLPGDLPRKVELLSKQGSPIELNVSAQGGFPPVGGNLSVTGFSIDLQLTPGISTPQAGMLLPLRFMNGSQGLLKIDRTDILSVAGTGPAQKTKVRLMGSQAWKIRSQSLPNSKKWEYQSTEILDWTLSAFHPDGRVWRLENLGFTASHPRSFLALPDDRLLFPSDDRGQNPRPDVERNGLRDQARHPRFPVAGPGTDKPDLLIPLGMDEGIGTRPRVGPLGDQDAATALQRNGLGEFKTSLFIHPDLSGVGSARIESEAFSRLFPPDGSIARGKALRGMHTLFFHEEPTLICVPDAIHTGWTRVPAPGTGPNGPSADFLNGPTLLPPAWTETVIKLQWSPVPGADGYLVEAGWDRDFLTGAVSLSTTQVTLDFPVEPACPRFLFFRVRATQGSFASAWSNTRFLHVPPRDFEERDPPFVEAPRMLPPQLLASGHRLLKWIPAEPAEAYAVELGRDADFFDAEEIFRGGNIQFELAEIPDQMVYFRVAAIRNGNPGPASNAVALVPNHRDLLRTKTADEYDGAPLLELHTALLRMGLARADLLCMLGLPRHFRETEAARHKGKVVSSLVASGEDKALSYAAMYHPWILARDGEETRFTPPEGAVCGYAAFRALSRGAWIAPANGVLKGAMGIEEGWNLERAARLSGYGINPVAEESRGITVERADTLSLDPDLLPINVRRLLILLRRLALREGNEILFEPNGAATQRRAESLFRRMLSELYRLGAFAGDTPNEAYQVAVEDLPDNQNSRNADEGRFYVELRVAPAKPLEFLIVRLINAGDGRPLALEI